MYHNVLGISIHKNEQKLYFCTVLWFDLIKNQPLEIKTKQQKKTLVKSKNAAVT